MENTKNEQQCCIYCNGVATDEQYLISIYAPGTYFQHWNLKTQRGCPENKENIAPNGEKVNVSLKNQPNIKPSIPLKQMLVVWFSKIEWREYFTLLMWRLLIIPLFLPLMVTFLPAIVVNVLIWFITGNGYMYEIENATKWYLTKIWNKVFPL